MVKPFQDSLLSTPVVTTSSLTLDLLITLVQMGDKIEIYTSTDDYHVCHIKELGTFFTINKPSVDNLWAGKLLVNNVVILGDRKKSRELYQLLDRQAKQKPVTEFEERLLKYTENLLQKELKTIDKRI